MDMKWQLHVHKTFSVMVCFTAGTEINSLQLILVKFRVRHVSSQITGQRRHQKSSGYVTLTVIDFFRALVKF